jgi:hypothetical protein
MMLIYGIAYCKSHVSEHKLDQFNFIAGHGGMFSETQFRESEISFDTPSQTLALFQGKYY